MAGRNEQPIVACRGVWKLFGARVEEALAALQKEPLGKAEILSRFDCVLGVADASFDVRPGEIFCIMGLSGSGKSTLVRHINGLIQPTVGQVLIDGEDIAKKDPATLRRLRAEKIGMVFQNFALLPHRTVIENVAFGLELRKVPRAQRMARAEKVLETVQLGGWAHRWPDELSGGMQQRVGLARALAGDPEILLMDEPFGALDPLIRRQLQDQFLELSRAVHKTTIFITHDLEEAFRVGSRVAIMRDGRIVQIGTPVEILRNPADDYVADFLSGLSPAKVLRASDIMTPLNGQGLPTEAGSWPKARPDSDLALLADLLTAEGDRVLIADDKAQALGWVDRASVLKTLARRQHYA
jgi:glycine betaine/proline transport system ATP-binding protein